LRAHESQLVRPGRRDAAGGRPRSARTLWALAGGLALAAATGCAHDGATLVEQFNNAVARHHLERGERLASRQRADEALAEFDAALQRNPKLAAAHAQIGRIRNSRGELAQAARHFAEALRLDPLDGLTAFALGQVYQLMSSSPAERRDKLRLAARAYLHACELMPGHFDAHLALGVVYHQLGELDQAVHYYRQSLRIDPRNTFAMANLGAAYDSVGKYYEAVNVYKTALEQGGNEPMLLVNLATTLIRQTRFEAALEVLQRAMAVDPNVGLAHQRAGYCLAKLGRFSEALAAYGRGLELNPRSAEAHAGRGMVFMAMYLRNPSYPQLKTAALEHWHRSMELDSNQPRLRTLLARYAPPQHPGQDLVLGQ
jgi:tetratricopeptide (TPR) repeat protein